MLLPNKRSQLQLSWKGQFIVTEKVGICDYRVNVYIKSKLFQANFLKRYSRNQVCVAAIVRDENDMKEDKLDSEKYLVSCHPENGILLPILVSTETPDDVVISSQRSMSETGQLKDTASDLSQTYFY